MIAQGFQHRLFTIVFLLRWLFVLFLVRQALAPMLHQSNPAKRLQINPFLCQRSKLFHLPDLIGAMGDTSISVVG